MKKRNRFDHVRTQVMAARVERSSGRPGLYYTDGAIEATDGNGRQLEIDGLRAIFEGMRGGTSTSVLEKTLNGVLEHSQGRVHDDVALLLIQRCAGA